MTEDEPIRKPGRPRGSLGRKKVPHDPAMEDVRRAIRHRLVTGSAMYCAHCRHVYAAVRTPPPAGSVAALRTSGSFDFLPRAKDAPDGSCPVCGLKGSPGASRRKGEGMANEPKREESQ